MEENERLLNIGREAAERYIDIIRRRATCRASTPAFVLFYDEEVRNLKARAEQAVAMSIISSKVLMAMMQTSANQSQ